MVVVGIFIDFVLMTSLSSYHTVEGHDPSVLMPGGLGAWTITQLPFSAVLRPLLLLFRFKSIGEAAQVMVLTCVRARIVFILIFLFLLIATVQSVILFANMGIGCDSFLEALVTQFVYLFFGENFVDVVYPVTVDPCSTIYGWARPGCYNSFCEFNLI